MKPLRIAVVGRGKVGSALVRAWRGVGWQVAAVSARRARRVIDVDLLVLAVPDRVILEVAERLCHTRAAAVVHCAGAFGCEVLAPFRAKGIAVAKMHPLLSFADRRRASLPPAAAVLVAGDRRAERIAVRAVRALGLVPLVATIDPLLYHAAAAIVSNGAVALADLGAELLVSAGIDRRRAAQMLAPLLASTAANLGAVGLPAALTGPIRRGDVETVAGHLAAVARHAPKRAELVGELVLAQLEIARRAIVGDPEGPDLENFAAIEGLVRRTRKRSGVRA